MSKCQGGLPMFGLLTILAITQMTYMPVFAQGLGQPWKNKSLSPDERADLLAKQMTLDEKIQLLHGSFGYDGESWHIPGWKNAPGSHGEDGYVPGIPHLGIPDLRLLGAGAGVTNIGQRPSGKSTALPSPLAEAATWDPAMAYAVGTVIGKETRDEGFNISIGGGVDLARDPRNGRNFEYHGEDPILAGKMIARELRAIQDQGVIATIKHYAMNDQESGRNSVSANIDKRSMRETDLLAFEIGIKESDASAVMCAYNRVNGVYSCENSYLLNDVLKKDWGFQGWVMSDWGATHSTAKAALAGLDQEFYDNKYFAGALQTAVERGDVPMERLDNMVHRILRMMFAFGAFDNPPVAKPIDAIADAAVARRVEEAGAVLLENAGGQLPLNASTLHSIAVIGSHADVGVLSGGGSSQVDPIGGNAVPPKNIRPGLFASMSAPTWDPSLPLMAIRAKALAAKVEYDSGTDVGAAAKLAGASDVVIVFANQWTSEGRDVPNLSLPDNQDQLISQVASANAHTIVVLETGGPVSMPWLNNVSAVLEAWYPGQRGGEAIAGLLFGDVNPSGKLPITFPKNEAQLPRPVIQGPPPPGNGFFDVDYTEGLKVGYKWYDAEGKKPLFPFGFGLSYTNFSYSKLQTIPMTTDGTKEIRVSFDLRNLGSKVGAEVAQVYLGFPASVAEPPKRLVGWAKVSLAAGQTQRVTVAVDPHAASHPLSLWNDSTNAWDIATGDYKLYVGSSSEDIRLVGALHIHHHQR